MALLGVSWGDVIINEFKAAQDERLLVWTEDGIPQLGTGAAWWDRAFDATQWSSGEAPFGFGRTGIQTDLGTVLHQRSPSVYLRRTFTASTSQAASDLSLILTIEFNDGMVAYLNGKEAGRAYMGPRHGFVYADQVAASARPANAPPMTLDLGPASDWLVPGENVLALQVHNASVIGDLTADAHLGFAGATTVDDSGGLAHTFEAGNTAPVLLHLPPIDLAASWDPGQVSALNLANTIVSFQALVPPGLTAKVGVQAGDGSGPVAQGLPGLNGENTASLLGYWRFDEGGASEGSAITSMDNSYDIPTLDGTRRGTPAYSVDVPGSKIWDPLTQTLRDNAFSMDATLEDSRLRIPNNALLNTDSFTIEFFIKLIGEPESFETFARRTQGDGEALSSDRRRWKIDFDHGQSTFGGIRGQWDTPGTPPLDYARVVRGNRIYVDTDSGDGDPASYEEDDPADEGNGVNDRDQWHHVAMTYDAALQQVRFYTDGQVRELLLQAPFEVPDTYIEVGKFGETYGLLIDEVRYTGRALVPGEFLQVQSDPVWQTYEATLGDLASADAAALTTHLNGTSKTALRLILEVAPDSVSSISKTLQIDNLRVTTHESDFEAYPIRAGSTWRYLPGLMEPSGGVFDRAAWEDPNGERGFSDWIELHNDSATPVNLSGWTLTDDLDEPDKWSFPNGTTISGNGYLLVLADEQIDLAAPNLLHADFKLSASGEALGLFDDSGVLQSSVTFYPTQYVTASHGIGATGNLRGYLEYPTPGVANMGPALIDRVDAPDFDVKGGFYEDAVTVTLTSKTEGALIRYTEDGTEPTLSHGMTYTAPIIVTKRSSTSGRILRARAFLDGMIPSKTKLHTYLIDQDSRLRSAPALAFAADLPRQLYRPFGVLAIQGGTYIDKDWEATGPDDYNYPFHRGRAHERPIHAEFYWPDGTAGFRTDLGVRVAASNAARPELILDHLHESPWQNIKREKPSFNLFLREDYGNPSVTLSLNGPQYPVDEFEQFRVRAGKNDIDNPFIKDEWVRRLYRDMGHVSSQGVINSLYVNGDFKGYYNMVERLREPFFNAHAGLPGSADWDILQAGNPDNLAEGDRLAWDAFIAALNAPVSEAHWNQLLGQADLVNMADYFLLNIYMAMWDWPRNNWVAARLRETEGRYRFYVWDAEGAIFENEQKDVDYDTIEKDLNSDSTELPLCWQGLLRWPEFRMLMADRIHHHFFNGGVLDDRDFDDSILKARFDGLESEFAGLLDLIEDEALDRENLERWVDASEGRRNYLFGPARQDFADHGLWPGTAPVTFNQHGGDVPPGFALTLSHGEPSSATVYYTTDGTDPRAYGGTVNGTARPYPAGGINLNDPTTQIRARVRTTSGDWSPLTEATFLAGTVAPTPNNLAIVEVHYHPSDAINDEITVSTDRDDYEFIQLRNTGTQTLDLNGVWFDGSVEGIDFQFTGSRVTTLAPGAHVMVVKLEAAFIARYGNDFNDAIAGVYGGRLSNSGEQITLRAADGTVLQQVTYDDKAPWPAMADGLGRSLQRKASVLPANDPAAWEASPVYRGTPGGVIPQWTFSEWQALHFTEAERNDPNISGPLADPDGDGLVNQAEFAFGTLPRQTPSAEIPPVGEIINHDGDDYLGLTFQLNATASGLIHSVEVSGDHGQWTTDAVETASPDDRGNGAVIYQVRDTVPIQTTLRRFLRLRFTEAP